MSDIKVVIGQNIRKESVLINPSKKVDDTLVMDGEGKPTGAVIYAENVIVAGNSRKEVLQKAYGSRF